MVFKSFQIDFLIFFYFTAEEYLTMKTDDALDTDVPLLFISFPSTKDPQWDEHPQRQVSNLHCGTDILNSYIKKILKYKQG